MQISTNRSSWRWIDKAFIAAFLVVVITNTSASDAPPPHLILVAVDDLGWADVSHHGSNFPTPNFDQLIKEGVSLDRYYVQQVCSPTRSALMTAKYPFHTGLQHFATLAPGSMAAIPKDTSTIAEVLKVTGYATHAIGKWHLGFQGWDDTPIGRGFDSHAGYFNGAIDYFTHDFGLSMLTPGNGTPATAAGLDFWRNKTAAWDFAGQHSTPFYMAEASRILDNHDPKTPVFLYFAHQLAHEPLEEVPSPHARAQCAGQPHAPSPIGPENVTKARHTLCTMVSGVDTAVGELVDMLKAKGMWENTVMWVTTDNGGMTHGPEPDGVGVWSASSNFPLRGGKTTLFEGGVRGVSFVTGGFLPVAARGKIRDALMMHVDIPATMASLAGAKWEHRSAAVDGLDMWEVVVSGAASPRTEVPVNVDTCVGAITGGPPCAKDRKFNALITADGWKLIEANIYIKTIRGLINCPNTTWCTGAGLYDGWWSNDPYTRTAPNATTQGPMAVSGLREGGIWLFNITADPNEEVNLAASHPEVVRRMRNRLTELADPKNGYHDPQENIPDPRSLPVFHNGTWAPFRKVGEKRVAMTPEQLRVGVNALGTVYWD